MKKKILVVLGSGGHTTEVLQLVKLLGARFDYEYVIGKEDSISEKKIVYKGKVYRMLNPRIIINKNILIVLLRMFPATFDAIRGLFQSKPDAILSVGPSLTLPLFFIAKLLSIKTIFIETVTRVNHKSLTGKFAYPFSDLFFVQWESMKKLYPEAIYAGRLL